LVDSICLGPVPRKTIGLRTLNDKSTNSLYLKVTSVKNGDEVESVTVIPYGKKPECVDEQKEIIVDTAVPWDWSCTLCHKDCLIRKCYVEETVLCNACKLSQTTTMSVDQVVEDDEDD